MIRLCHHLFATNFITLSPNAKLVWLYAAVNSGYDGVVNIHLRVLPRLAGLTDSQSDEALKELAAHNFYDDDKPPFLTAHEIKDWSVSKVLLWECQCCCPIRRKEISAELRAEILSIGICAYCDSTEDLEVDHIRPVSLGGSNDRENLQPLCFSCNRRKGAHFIG